MRVFGAALVATFGLMAGGLAGTALAGPGGGAKIVTVPKISKISCVANCGERGALQPGSKIRINGKDLSSVSRVVFLGGRSKADDTAVAINSTAKSIELNIPATAASGRVAVIGEEGIRSKPSRPIRIVPPAPIIAEPELKTTSDTPGGGPKLETGTSTPRKVFFGARRMVVFSYRVTDKGPATATVDLIRTADGQVVKSWPASTVQPGAIATVEWDGTVNNEVQPDGRYAFRLTASGTNGALAKSSAASNSDRDAFDFYGHMFPIRGPHTYSSGAGRFGDDRGGRSHQGEDVFAKCGTPLVAARGGVIKFKQYHSAAGNYIVIDVEGTDLDYAYMHMRSPSPFKTGDRVYTGQVIGQVGDTGRASGCHLHFETWSGPGWYDGGRPLDPLPAMKQWDAVS